MIQDSLDETKMQTVSETDAPNLEETRGNVNVCESQFSDSYWHPSNFIESDSNRGESPSRPLVSFTLRVGAGAEIASDFSRDVVVLEMMWVDGENKNDLYQLFQFLQNKILKGL